jgi:hypothetical protein
MIVIRIPGIGDMIILEYKVMKKDETIVRESQDVIDNFKQKILGWDTLFNREKDKYAKLESERDDVSLPASIKAELDNQMTTVRLKMTNIVEEIQSFDIQETINIFADSGCRCNDGSETDFLWEINILYLDIHCKSLQWLGEIHKFEKLIEYFARLDRVTSQGKRNEENWKQARELGEWYKRREKEEEEAEQVLNAQRDELDAIIFEVCSKHREALASELDRHSYIDTYGNRNQEQWEQKARSYFINTVIRPMLNHSQNMLLDEELSGINLIIDSYALSALDSLHGKNGYHSKMSGTEYEKLCKRILEDEGWNVQTTKTTGDQGVDLIASKSNIKVAIQCKKSLSTIGNKAVQEIVSGAKHYHIFIPVVVSNADFTPQAKTLAFTNHVLLLHHNELIKLVDIVTEL